MDFSLLKEALESSGVVLPKRIQLSDSTKKFLEEYKVPTGTRAFIEEFSFTESIKINYVYLDCANEIAGNNLYEENKRCIDNGLLIVGSGLNGDAIVVDLNNEEVGYVFHDELWEDEKVSPRDIFISLECNVSEFYHNSLTIEDYPVDGIDAEELINNKK